MATRINQLLAQFKNNHEAKKILKIVVLIYSVTYPGIPLFFMLGLLLNSL
jgi:hypothetical protein